MKFFNSKICASIVANAFYGLHNGKYTKYLPRKNCGMRASIIKVGGLVMLRFLEKAGRS